MRRLGALIRGLPVDSALAREMALEATDESPPEPADAPSTAEQNLAFAQRFGQGVT